MLQAVVQVMSNEIKTGGNSQLFLTKSAGEKLIFPYDFKQTFHHEPKLLSTPKEYVLIRDFYHFDEDRQAIEREILEFLRDFGFATETQLRLLVGSKGLNPDRIDDILESCVKDRVVNYFALTQFVMEEVPEDAFRIYCLDHGARYILTHFSQTDFITWLSSDNIRSSELVAKYLMTGMFYLQVLMARGDSLRFFNPLADFSIGKRDIRFSGAFQIIQGFTPRDFIFEVIRHEDLPTIWQQKVNEKVAPFVLQSYWEMYYRNMPVFLFLTQNDEDAFQAAEIFHMRTKLDNFRMLTDPNLMRGLGNAPFYAYVPESDKNPRPALKKVKAKIFSGEA